MFRAVHLIAVGPKRRPDDVVGAPPAIPPPPPQGGGCWYCRARQSPARPPAGAAAAFIDSPRVSEYLPPAVGWAAAAPAPCIPRPGLVGLGGPPSPGRGPGRSYLAPHPARVPSAFHARPPPWGGGGGLSGGGALPPVFGLLQVFRAVLHFGGPLIP